MLEFQIVCAFFTLFVLQNFVFADVDTKRHRLLPVILYMIAFYNFCEIVRILTGEDRIFSILEDIILLQALYILVNYICDLLRIKWSMVGKVLLFSFMLVTNTLILLKFGQNSNYWNTMEVIVYVYILVILMFATAAYLRMVISKRERHVSGLLYLQVFFPTIAVSVKQINEAAGRICISLSLVITCAIVYYMIKKGLLMDISTRMQENMFELLEDPVVLLDEDFYPLDANVAAKELLQLQHENILKKKNREIFQPKSQKVWNAKDHEQEIVFQNRYLRLKINKLDLEGGYKGYQLTVYDITKQKINSMNMEIQKDKAKMEVAEKSRFLAMMSHDLRTPIHTMMGVDDILLNDKNMSLKNRTLLEESKIAGHRMLESVDSILLFSKSEAAHLELKEDRYDFYEMLKELGFMEVMNLGEKKVDFRIIVENSFPRICVGDKEKVLVMLQNLMSNAVKFTREGSIECRIKVSPETNNRVKFDCRVIDTGVGMSEEKLSTIFKEYVTYAGDSLAKGTGLGLSIVKRLAVMMQGDAYASSDGQSGSELGVSFIQGYEKESQMDPVTFEKDEFVVKTNHFAQRIQPKYCYPNAKILIADDMKMNQKILADLLEIWKIKTDFVPDGKTAITMAKNNKYNCIMLDRMMPGMDGNETAKEIRKFSDAKLVAVTADVTELSKSEWEACGYTFLLHKPIELEKLEEALYTLLPADSRELAEEKEQFLTGENQGMYQNELAKVFCKEMEELLEVLEQYAKQDLKMFRTKIHGIKSVSKQIPLEHLAREAEVLEMAAKLENEEFIFENLEPFLQELRETVHYLREKTN